MVSWKGKWIWLGYLISAGGVLWNTETGIGCIIGFSAYILVVQWQKESPLSKVSFLSYLLVACAALLSMLFPVGIVNLYNFACGMSNPVFRVFFYPYISGSWATESLRCNVPLGNHAWIYILMLLLGCLAWGMYHTRLLRGNSETFIQEAPVLAGMSTTGLIVFAYYINEAHWGCMDIVHQIAVCLSAVILAKLWFVMTRYSSYGLFHHQIQRAVVLLAVMIYSILAIQIADDPVRIAARNKAGAYTLAQVNEDIKILLEEIPVNTYGVGQSVNILYHEIGWSNHARFRDTTSIGLIDEHGSYNKLLQEILKQDSFLIASQNPVDKKLKTDILAHDPSYVLQKQICINGHIFSYMVRDQSSMSD